MTIPGMIAKATCFLIGHKYSCERCGTMGDIEPQPRKLCKPDTCSTVGGLQVKNEDLKAMLQATKKARDQYYGDMCKYKEACTDLIKIRETLYTAIEKRDARNAELVEILKKCLGELEKSLETGTMRKFGLACDLKRVLSTTPTEAYGRVQGLVRALEAVLHKQRESVRVCCTGCDEMEAMKRIGETALQQYREGQNSENIHH